MLLAHRVQHAAVYVIVEFLRTVGPLEACRALAECSRAWFSIGHTECARGGLAARGKRKLLRSMDGDKVSFEDIRTIKYPYAALRTDIAKLADHFAAVMRQDVPVLVGFAREASDGVFAGWNWAFFCALNYMG